MAIIPPMVLLKAPSVKNSLQDGNIVTMIGLPAKHFYSTGIPVCVVVPQKCKKSHDDLIINASGGFQKGKRQINL